MAGVGQPERRLGLLELGAIVPAPLEKKPQCIGAGHGHRAREQRRAGCAGTAVQPEPASQQCRN